MKQPKHRDGIRHWIGRLHTDSDGNAYPGGDGYSNTDSDDQADGYIHTQADSHGYPAAANAYGHLAADGDPNGYSVSDRHGHGYPQGNRHAAADRHPTAHQTRDYDAHRRRRRREHRGQHAFTDGPAKADGCAHRTPTDGSPAHGRSTDRESHSGIHPWTGRDGRAEYCHTTVRGRIDPRDTDAHSEPDSHANPHAHSNTNRRTDPKAHANAGTDSDNRKSSQRSAHEGATCPTIQPNNGEKRR